MRSRTLCTVVAIAAFGCAAPPRLRTLDDADRIQSGPQAGAARETAPQAVLRAEALHGDARTAFANDDRATAQMLAEHAIAAYQRAFVLARLAAADTRRTEAEKELTGAEHTLADLDAQQTRVAAEADDLEMRVRVARDAVPLAPVGPASAERERARLDAARSLAVDARLLCVAAELLAPGQAGLPEARGELDALDAAIAATPKVAPIDPATRLRASCLAALTAARRPAMRTAPEVNRGDELLEKLSVARAEPFRDDRGVVVVLRDSFRGTHLVPAAAERLKGLAETARELGDTPILAVVHGAKGPVSNTDRERLAETVALLQTLGAPKVTGHTAGSAKPVLPPDGARAAKQNERLEIVFVTRSW